MTSGKKCEAPALKGEHFCYYHTRLHIAAKKITPSDSIEIPVIEDRCSLQLVLALVLKALVNNNIDRHRAGLLLYGLQIASQTVDRGRVSSLGKVVKSITRTRTAMTSPLKESTASRPTTVATPVPGPKYVPTTIPKTPPVPTTTKTSFSSLP